MRIDFYLWGFISVDFQKNVYYCKNKYKDLYLHIVYIFGQDYNNAKENLHACTFNMLHHGNIGYNIVARWQQCRRV